MIVTVDREGAVAIVTIDNPPVNALSRDLRQALLDTAEALDADPSLEAAVLICSGRTFIAGADVGEFDLPPREPHLPDVVSRIENARLPWVAAIHGAALGGGLEVALGCHYRVAAPEASLGLPEVNLGIIPGAGGTVRLPRLVGFVEAVGMITSGKSVKARKALAIRLVDALVDGDLRSGAMAFARDIAGRPMPPAIRDRVVEPPSDEYWNEQRQAIARRAKGEIAPVQALASLRRAAEADFDAAMAFERTTFLELRASEQAKALRHVFFAERAAARPPKLAGIKAIPVRNAAVIGGGTMGAGICATLLDAALPVILIERDEAALEKGLAGLRRLYDSSVERGRLTREQADGRIARLRGSVDYKALEDIDLVIEAVFEDLAVKRAVFARLGADCRPDAILATNTSYLNPVEIAAGLPHPERFLGLHFFSPANVMKLLEIVPAPSTAAATLVAVFALAQKLGKVPVEAGICDGFIGNRILKRYRAGAEDLLRRGVAIADVDAAMRAFGFAMGPFEAQDLGGLDITFLQREAARARGEDVPEALADRLVKAGRNGQKTGAGWYDYRHGDRKPHVATVVGELLGLPDAGKPMLQADEIAARLVADMAEEGHAILADGIATKASDIDLVLIHGYGFPRWHGGPMFLAERTKVASYDG